MAQTMLANGVGVGGALAPDAPTQRTGDAEEGGLVN
jgi:hypothetical protein